jgi:anti-anti-sigma factor
MPFELVTRRLEHVLLIEIVGEFVLSQKLRRCSTVIRDAGDATAFVVDLSQCGKLDSAGLGELLMWYSLAMRSKKKVLLIGVKESIKGVMQTARVDGILLGARDLEAALAELRA